MIQFLNIPAASIFKTQMFWAMENGTPATSRHTMCPITSVSIMPLRSKGYCLSYHLFIQCVASKRHPKAIPEPGDFNSSFSAMAKLANKYPIFKYVHIQPDHFRNC